MQLFAFSNVIISPIGILWPQQNTSCIQLNHPAPPPISHLSNDQPLSSPSHLFIVRERVVQLALYPRVVHVRVVAVGGLGQPVEAPVLARQQRPAGRVGRQHAQEEAPGQRAQPAAGQLPQQRLLVQRAERARAAAKVPLKLQTVAGGRGVA